MIEPYTVFNAGVSVDLVTLVGSKKFGNILSQLQANFRINNIFDVLYETSGNVDSYGTPYWIPAAERNFYIDLKVGF